MKKLICNIGSITLGVFASIMSFVPMFGMLISMYGRSEIVSEYGFFGLFKKPSNLIVNVFDALNNGFKDIFRIIAMILAIIAIIAVALIVISFIAELLGNKKSIFTTLKKYASFALIAIAVLIAIATIIFMVINKVYEDGATGTISVSNWFAYLSVIIGFAGSGLFAIFAKD